VNLPAEPAFAETPALRKASGGGLRAGRQVLWQAGAGVTLKYLRKKGVMKKIELTKKRRFNGSEDEIIKNNYQ
jgi:hypothetical protein